MQVRDAGHQALPVGPREGVAGFQTMNPELYPVCKQHFTELKLGPFLNHCDHCKGDVTQREVKRLPQAGCSNCHSGQQKHPCPFCSKLFGGVGNLNVHLRIHWGYKPHRCEHCDKSFTQKGNLTVHLRVHSGEKPYFCEQCDKRFAQKGNLKVHMHTHTGHRPYKCEFCHKGFSQINNLREHRRVHTGEKPYACSQCGRHFARKVYLKKHKRIHTNDNSYECGQSKSLVVNKQSALHQMGNEHINANGSTEPVPGKAA